MPVMAEMFSTHSSQWHSSQNMRSLLASASKLTLSAAAVNFSVLRTGHWDLVQVDHCIAVAADEVNVGIGVGIEPFHTVDSSDYAG